MLSLRTQSTRHIFNNVQLASTSKRHASSDSEGPNQAIIQLLNRHMNAEQSNPSRNVYKIRAFASAIKVISHLDHPIRSITEAKNLRGVGPGILRRIGSILSGEEYEHPSIPNDRLQKDLAPKSTSDLELVSGVGPVKAKKLFEAGCKTIADMHKSKYYEMLTPAMKVGLKYFQHLDKRVSRPEAEIVEAFIIDNISSRFEVHLVGSYRRGASTSSDIDILLFHPSNVHIPTPSLSHGPCNATRPRITTAFRSQNTKRSTVINSMLLNQVVKPLEDRGLIAASLVAGLRKWQGVVRVPERLANGAWGEWGDRVDQIKHGEGAYRRMDLKSVIPAISVLAAQGLFIRSLVPMKSRGAALLALTGDVHFNKDIRLKASRLGMHLNEFGLWSWQSESGETGDDSVEGAGKGYWELLMAESEEEILREIGMDYIDPEKRNFSFVLGQASHEKRGKPKRA